MSNVVRSKRKPTRFEAEHHLKKLRDDITKLCINDFGYSLDKCRERRARYETQHKDVSDLDKIMKRYDKKLESFDRWFIDDECAVLVQLLRNIDKYFTLGNSIYPSDNIAGFAEYLKRREHITTAISLCYVLKHEINYIIRTLPVDNNKYQHISADVDKQIQLFKGVRKADNRFLKVIKYPQDIMEYLLGIERRI